MLTCSLLWRPMQGGAYAVPRSVKAIRLVTDHAIPTLILPKGVRIRKKVPLVPALASDIPLIMAEVYSKNGVEAPALTMLYLHGGAYCCCSSSTHRLLLGEICSATGIRIVAIDYRRPPEHPYPAACHDAVRA